jgi:hypothetical protein
MLKTIPLRIAVGVAISAVAGGIALAFGLQRTVANIISDYPLVVAGTLIAISGLIGLVGVCAWIALGVEHRLQDAFRPKLGSLAYRSIESSFQLEASGDNKLDIVITLVNQNDKLLAYTAETQLVVNGAIVVNSQSHGRSFTHAGQPTSLIFTAHDVPVEKINDKVGSVSVIVRYLLRYAYEANWTSATKRITSKTISFQTPVRLGEPEGSTGHNQVFPRFVAEEET